MAELQTAAEVIKYVEEFYRRPVRSILRVPYQAWSATGDGAGGVRLSLPDRFGPVPDEYADAVEERP